MDTAPSHDWRQTLIEQLESHWNTLVRSRLDDLDDAEYLWEPVPGCWSIRNRRDATSPMAFGAGDAVVDYQWPEPTPSPVTTIAWRMAHVAVGVFGDYATKVFGAGDCHYGDIQYSLTARGGLDLLDLYYRRWVGGVRDVDEGALTRPVGAAVEDWADVPLADFILHVNREAIHHGAEMLLLRDLYRTSPRTGNDPGSSVTSQ